MNEISNDVIKHCQALANLTRHSDDEIISFTIMRGKTEILFLEPPSDELLSKCQTITSEELEKDADIYLTVRHTAEYSDDIELHWYEYKPLGEMGEKI
jgi:hypothetical protein